MRSTSVNRRRLSRAAGLAFAGVLAAAAPATAAPGQIVNDGAQGSITGGYIVVLNPNVADAVVGDLAREHMVNVRHRFKSSLNGFSGSMSRAEALELTSDPNVVYVEQDRTIAAFDTQADPPSWGLDRIDQRNLPLNKSYVS